MTPTTTARRRPPVPGRSRARMVLPLAVAGWTVLEIWLLTVLAGAVGDGNVLLLLLAGLVLGGYAVRRAGRRAWDSLTASVRYAGPFPGPGQAEPQQGPAGAGPAMLGGLLLMLPGLLSDGLGLLLLLPPTRKVLGALGTRLLARPHHHTPGSLGDAFATARIHRPGATVVQGVVIKDGEQQPDRTGSSGRGDRDDDAPRPPLVP